MAKTTDLAKRQPYADALQAKIDSLKDAGQLATLEADEDRMDEIVGNVLDATDDDDILGGTVPIGQLVGTIIRIARGNFLPSSFRDHDFAVFEWEAADGRRGVSTNGGPRLVAQLARAIELGKVPGWTVKVASSDVEYEPGMHGETYYFTKPTSK